MARLVHFAADLDAAVFQRQGFVVRGNVLQQVEAEARRFGD